MSSSSEASAQELHLLYVLLDSNLPTGGFVSSSGLESYAKHGFLLPTPGYTSSRHPSNTVSSDSTVPSTRVAGPSSVSLSPTKTAQAVVEFAKGEVGTYALSTLGFVRDAWDVVTCYLDKKSHTGAETNLQDEDEQARLDSVVANITQLDAYHEANLLSHVSRRSSKAQGIAMLTLYGRGLSRPPGFANEEEYQSVDGFEPIGKVVMEREDRAKTVIDEYKRLVRKGLVPGHLAVCWGVMTAAMGLSRERASHLHLFLHARSLLSSAVRLNLIGPYASSQLLLHPFRIIIKDQLQKAAQISTGLGLTNGRDGNADGEDFWSWAGTADSGPGTSWPLGEVLMGRHDLQHSRIFNS